MSARADRATLFLRTVELFTCRASFPARRVRLFRPAAKVRGSSATLRATSSTVFDVAGLASSDAAEGRERGSSRLARDRRRSKRGWQRFARHRRGSSTWPVSLRARSAKVADVTGLPSSDADEARSVAD